MIENIASFAQHNDVICLQESHTPQDSQFYNRLPSSLLPPFSNPSKDHSIAGTDILVRKDFAKSFDIDPIIVVPGRIQLLRFTPKGDSPLFNQAFSVMNIYLPSGSGNDVNHLRDSCLTTLCKVECDRLVFAAGDWNMTEHESDSAGGDHKATTPTTRKLFSNFLTTHGLCEVYQPTHTFFRANSSSRLDRIYVSHSPAEKCLMAPTVSIPTHPHMPGTGKDKGPSDHFPVQLTFYPTASSRHTRFKIPKFIANDSKFLQRVRDSLALEPHQPHPVKAWIQFKGVIRKAAIFVMRELRLKAFSKAALLTKSVGLFRSLRSVTLSFKSALRDLRDESTLRDAVLADSKTANLHLTHVQGLISSAFRSHPPSLPSPKSESFLKTAKSSLPGERRVLTHLFEDCKKIDDSVSMARLLHRNWSPVWNKNHPPPQTVFSYLDRYHKQLGSVAPISLSLVDKVVNKPKDSSTGPDGISFQVFRDLSELASPRLLSLILHIQDGGSGNAKMNHSNLFFIPKASTPSANAVRPISVSNADTRLIANIVRDVITVPINRMISKLQGAFRKDVCIDDNLTCMNKEFYTSQPDNTQKLMFVHDFQKAYDSVSRFYLLELMYRVGFPQTIMNVIMALFEKNVGLPILADAHNIKIFVNNGLRQGCPLSPILFNLAMDPLLTRLERLPDRFLCRAYCDDLAFCFLSSDWTHFSGALHEIELFNAASGSSSNTKKTVLLSSTELGLPGELPHGWRETKLVDSTRYLGVLFGRNITVNDVFRDSMSKLSRRVAQFLPFKRSFSLQNRVLISNSFLTPILSYLFRFFCLGEEDAVDVERLISSWVVPGRRFRYDHLTAQTHCAGLTIPLVDMLKMNLATLLSGLESIVPPQVNPPHYTIDGKSMLISEHTKKATSLFYNLTAILPPEDEAQRALYTILMRRDDTNMEALVHTLSPGLGPTNARLAAGWVVSRCDLLPRSLPSQLRTHAFLLIYNAVPTHDRLDPSHVTYALCELCGQARETLSHLHKECPVSRVSASRIIRSQVDMSKYQILLTSPPEDFIFRSPDTDKLHALASLCFSLAVWRTRCLAFGKPVTATSKDNATRYLVKVFDSLMESCTRKAAKNHRDKHAEKAHFVHELSLLPPHACIAYTDGSSYGNPGPAGAGFTVIPSVLGPATFSSVCLGEATNNVAELAALQFLCEHLFVMISPVPPCSRPPVFVFIDNKYAIESANSEKRCKANRRQVAMTRRAVSHLRTLTEVFLRWVPAHADVEGNEVADTLAKRGAKGTTSRAPPDPPPPPPSTPPIPLSSPVFHPVFELADDVDNIDDDLPPPPLAIPLPMLSEAKVPDPVISLRRSTRLERQVRPIPSALYRGEKVDFSLAWSTTRRSVSSSQEIPSALSLLPAASSTCPPHRKRKSSPTPLPRPATGGLGRLGWKRQNISYSSSRLSSCFSSSSPSSSSTYSSSSSSSCPTLRKRKPPENPQQSLAKRHHS